MRQCFSLGGERQGVQSMWAWGRFLGDRNVLHLVLGDSYMGYSIFKTHQIECKECIQLKECKANRWSFKESNFRAI